MTNTIANTEYSSLANSSKAEGTYRHGGIVIPVVLQFTCSTRNERLAYEEKTSCWKMETGPLNPPECATSHSYLDEYVLKPATCLIRLPLDNDHKLLQIENEIIRIVNERVFGMKDHLEHAGYGDHELCGLQVGMN
jgi:hypothetical protein